MTKFTVVRRRDMSRVLALRGGTIMTGEAVTGDRIMIESRPFPAHRPMTVSTLIRTLDMVHRLGCSHSANVAGFAIETDGGMIHARRFPKARGVAIAAAGLHRDMP